MTAAPVPTARPTEPGPDVAAALRREVRAVLAGPAAAPARAALDGPGATGEGDPRPLYRLLGAHRLLAPGWPEAYGGRSLPAADAAVVVEEMVAAGIPETPHTLSVQICGSFLLTAGSPAQRASVLPLLGAGRRLCTVLYSEEEAGSDLSGLATRADPAPGGGWRITGRKIWSVRAGLADLALVAARTSTESSRYQGLTLFLVPLSAPGVTVRELPSLAGEAFADVVLEGVPVDPEDAVGPVGGAWPLVVDALALERTGADHVAKAHAWLTLGVRQATRPPERWLPGAGRLATRTAAARALSRRCLAGLDRGTLSDGLAAATKLWCSETAREVAEWTWTPLGEAVLWQAGDAGAVSGGRLEAARREAPGLVISAGTSEMMREVVGATLAAGGTLAGDPDPVLGELAAAVRVVARDDLSWAELAGLGLFGLAVDPALGGLGLGLAAEVAACRALGAAGHDGGALDTLTVVAAVAAARPDDPARAALPRLLDGTRRGAVLLSGQPDRPLADPGGDGVLLAVHGLAGLADRPEAAVRLEVLDPGSAGVRRRVRQTSAGPVLTLALDPAAVGRRLSGVDGAGCTVLGADLLRRAAWLVGSGTAGVSATLDRTRSRRQFGRALIDNQVVAHRLADLTVHGEALGSLLDAEVARGVDTGAPGAGLAGPAGLLAEAGRFALAAARESLHLHGAAGMLRGSPTARAARAVPLAVAGGPPPDLLDRVAARPLLGP